MVLDILRMAQSEGILLFTEEGRLKFRAKTAGPSADLRSAIANHKQDLIAVLAQNDSNHTVPLPQAAEPGAPAPLSQTQSRILFQENVYDLANTYVLQSAYRFEGHLDVDRLSHALNAIVQRHSVLRSRFYLNDAGDATQDCLTDLSIGLDVAIDNQTSPESWLNAQTSPKFDLGAGELFRAAYLQANNESYLHFAFHHIAFDGWSYGCFFEELLGLYHNGDAATLPSLPFQYSDFARWQQDQEWPKASKEFWKKYLAGASILNNVKPDFARPAKATFSGKLHARPVDPDVLQQLKALAKQCGTSLYSVMLAAFYVVISRYSDSQDCVIGTPNAARDGSGLEQLIGFFANMVPIRLQVDQQLSFRDLIKMTHQANAKVQQHKDLHFEQIIEELGFSGESSFTPLTQIIFSFAEEADRPLIMDGLLGQSIPIEVKNLGFELELHLVGQLDGGLAANWIYSDKLFHQQTIQSIADTFDVALSTLIAVPDAIIAEHELVSPKQVQVWESQNNVVAPYPLETGFADLFERNAVQNPSAIACQWHDVSGKVAGHNYGDINELANGLALELQDRGIGVGSVVAVMIGSEADSLIGLLAVQKLGATYVIVDPSNPVSRNRAILLETKSEILISHELQNDFRELRCVSMSGKRSHQNPNRRENGWHSDQPALVIYTSGSTGTPKGAVLPHSALTNLIFASKDRLSFESGQCFGVTSTLTFDAHLFEIYVALAFGGRVALFEPTRFRDATRLQTDQAELDVDFLFSTPTSWKMLLDDGWVPRINQTIVSGGEPLSEALKNRLLSATPSSKLVNIYGPCECTGYTLADHMSLHELVHAGVPLPNTGAQILDRFGNRCPALCEGELFLSGAQVGLEYVGRSDLSAERFDFDPFAKGNVRRYATGDLARRWPDGRIEIVGRRDFQVKINGVRIEPGEIETALLSHAEIVQAAVVFKPNGTSGAQLVAYVQGSLNKSTAAKELSRFLVALLPPSHLPSQYVILDAFPLTSSGKINRTALPQTIGETISEQAVPPRNDVDVALCAIWSELVGRDILDISANFFAVGGTSLLAIKMLNKVNQKFSCNLALRDVIRDLTVEHLSTILAANRNMALSSTPAVISQVAHGQSVLSFSQERMWAIDQIDAFGRFYTIPMIFDIEGQFDGKQLATFMDHFVEQNPVLRTGYVQASDGASQFATPYEPGVLKQIDATDVSDPSQMFDDIEAQILNQPFDLAKGEVLRTALVKLSEVKHRWFLAVHHIAFDGTSLAVMLEELRAYFQTGSFGPQKRIKFADYAKWQVEHYSAEQDLNYWSERLQEAPATHSLPLDKPRPAKPSYKGETIVTELSEGTTEKLRELASTCRATEFSSIFAAFSTYLTLWQGEREIVIGTAVANREQEELNNIIGNFVNSVALHTIVDPYLSLKDHIDQAQKRLQTDMAHQAMPFEKLVEALQPHRSFAHAPIFQIMMLQDNSESEQLTLGQANLRATNPTETEAKFDLTLGIRSGRFIGFSFNYATDIFSNETITRLATNFVEFVERAIKEPNLSLSELYAAAPSSQIIAGPVKTINPFNFAQRFQEIASSEGNRIALYSGQNAISYSELSQRATVLAQELKRLGVDRGKLVGVHIERSIAMVETIIAIHKLGAAHLPLDPTYPTDRLHQIVQHACPLLIINAGSEFDLPVAQFNLMTKHFSPAAEGVKTASCTENTAYVIYTSGSTGKPKGVEIGHDSLCNYLDAATQDLGLDRDKTALQVTSLSFDISVTEILAPLSIGASIVLSAPKRDFDPDEIQELILRHSISFLQLVPSMLAILVEQLRPQTFKSVKQLLCGGEAVPAALLRDARTMFPEANILNVYGPTEATVWASSYEYVEKEHQGFAPIGKPLRNIEFSILDQNMHTVLPGQTGELYVGGAALARGYLHDIERTQEVFLHHPESRKRLYRTGDLVRQLADGDLTFLGRADSQVKIRGHRVELGDVEAQLYSLGAEHAACQVRGDRLIAFISNGHSDEVLAALAEKLPDYMIPSLVVQLADFPRTPNGKIDRRALAEMPLDEPESANYQAPLGEIEETLAEIWCEILERPQIGRHDNFFSIGGHSILAIRVISILREMLEQTVQVKIIFENPTIVTLAKFLEVNHLSEGDDREPT